MEIVQEVTTIKSQKLWMPRQVLITPSALKEEWGRKINERILSLGLSVEELKSNRIMGLRGEDERETYRKAKTTLAIVTAPPGAFKLQPIPPSADWQFHLAEGCPAHCQYCYLAGSLQGPPVTRVFANLPDILNNLPKYKKAGENTSYEASCYTDPLGIEHLTGSLSETIRFFGQQENMNLRWVSKFDHVDPLLNIKHNGNTRPRISINAQFIAQRMEGGTSSLADRLTAVKKLALPKVRGGGGYPIGLVIAPIMAIPDWEAHYLDLLDQLKNTLDFPCEISFELISHRFTPGSKSILQQWYPNTQINFDENTRTIKFNKYGGKKYVYSAETMSSLKKFFYNEISIRFPKAKILYWT